MSKLLLKRLTQNGYEVVGFVEGGGMSMVRGVPHKQRVALAAHLTNKAIANSEAAQRAIGRRSRALSTADAQRWDEVVHARLTLFARRLMQHRALTMDLSLELARAGR